jgi:hypothetical protein
VTTLSKKVAHVLTAPHRVVGSGMFYGWCTCGEEFVGATAEAIRDAGKPHRQAELERLAEVEGKAADVGR